MDGRDFDNLVRQLGRGQSRRTLLRGFLGGGAVLAAAGTRSVLGAGPNSVQICHNIGNGSYRLISVAPDAVDAHLAHGDGFLGSDAHCSDCSDVCGEAAYCNDYACVSDEPTSCSAGSAPDGQGDCVECAPGYASADGLTCESCAVDTFAANSGQVTCSPCDSGYTTDGATGAAACTPVIAPLICTAANECQSQCPGANSPYCYCGTAYDTGDPVCYYAEHGCPGPYCQTASDCGAGETCVNLNGACGGCDNYILDRNANQPAGVCNRICVTGD